MPEIEPYLADDAVTPVSPPSPRTALFWDGTHWHVPRVDDEGRVQVRGEDQLFSLKGVLADYRQSNLPADNGAGVSNPVPAGEYWIVTNVVAMLIESATTIHYLELRHDGTAYTVRALYKAFAATERSSYSGHVYADPSDTIEVSFTGGLAGDTARIWVTGYRMTLEV